MAAPQGDSNPETKRLSGSTQRQCNPTENQLPLRRRLRTTQKEVATGSFKFEVRAFAVSPRSPLLMTRLPDNLYIWGALDTNPAQSKSDTSSDYQPSYILAASNTHLLSPTPKSGTDFTAETIPKGACSNPASCFAALSLGDGHSAAITIDGELLTWGRNARGQCGHAHEQDADPSCPLATYAPSQPVRFPLLTPAPARPRHAEAHIQIRAVACGGEHTIAITTAGVFAWGCNKFGQCGLGHNAPDAVLHPIPIPSLSGSSVVCCQLAAGRYHSLVLTSASQVLAWGDGALGQLGLGDQRQHNAPKAIEALWGLPVVQIAAGDAHSAAVTSSGHAFTWGCNSFSQLGFLPQLSQREVQLPSGAAAPVTRGSGHVASTSVDAPQQQLPATVGDLAHSTWRGDSSQQRALAENDDVQFTAVARERLGQPRPLPMVARVRMQQQFSRPCCPPSVESPATQYSRPVPQTEPSSGSGTPRSTWPAMTRWYGSSRHVNPQWLLAMIEMGIPSGHARIALMETGNAGVEVATEWLFAGDRSAILDKVFDNEAGTDAVTSAARPSTRVTEVTSASNVATRRLETMADAAACSATLDCAGRQPATHLSCSNGGLDSGGCGHDHVAAYASCADFVYDGGSTLRKCQHGSNDCAERAAVGQTEEEKHTWERGTDKCSSRDSWWEELAVSEPRRVPLKDVRFLATGARHTVAVTDAGVYAWGDGTWGALGLGDCESRNLPCRLDAFLPPVAAAAATGGSTAAPDSPRSSRPPAVTATGGNQMQSLRHVSGAAVAARPQVVTIHTIHRVACGAQHTLFLAQDGSVFWCGTMPYCAAAETTAATAGNGVAAPFCAPSVTPSVPREASVADGEQRAATGGDSGGTRMVFSATPRRLVMAVDPGGRQTRRTTDATTDPVACDVVARGSSSGVLFCSRCELPQMPQSLSMPCGQRLLENLRGAIVAAAQEISRPGGAHPARLSTTFKAVTRGVRTVLGSPAAISAAFGRPSGMGLDGQLLEDVMNSIRNLFVDGPNNGDGREISCDGPGTRASSSASGGVAAIVADLHRYSLVAALQAAATALVDDLMVHTALLAAPERAVALLAALQHPLLAELPCARQLLPRLAATVMDAPPVVRIWLVRWWAEYPGPLLESRVVTPLQGYLTRELGATKKLTTPIMNVIKVLSHIEEAASLSRSLPPEAFYNTLISEKLDVQDHYCAWRQAQELAATCSRGQLPREAPFSFCSYPFLLTARAKSHLLHLEATFQMEQTVAHARMEVQFYGRGAQQRAAERLVKSASFDVNDSCGGSGMGGSSSSMSGRGTTTTTSRSSSAQRIGRDGEEAADWSYSGSSGGSSASVSGGGGSCTTAGGGSVGRNESNQRCMGICRSFVFLESMRWVYWVLRRRLRSLSGTSSSGGGYGQENDPTSRDQQMKPRNGAPIELSPPSECSVPGVHSDMCIVRIRRTHLVDDALEELGRQVCSDLLKPLRVHFIGEEGIDAGGIKKEFFALLIERLLSPDYGMMSYDEASRTYWFNPASLEPPYSFFLLGLALGLAVYNRVLLDFPAPLLLFQKLQGGRELGLRDLEGWQPELVRGLRQLLEYDGHEPMSEVFGLTFSVDVDHFGSMVTIPLKSGSELNPVTEDNRAEYVTLLAAWHMVGSVAGQFEAFAAGFRLLCRGPAMSLFNAQELEQLMCGNPRLDFAALQEAAHYDGGYSRDSPVVRWMWEIVLHELSQQDQRAFLKFFTGSDRSPLGGLGSLHPVIQRDGPDSHKLPTAHTCFNTLLLPEYDNRVKLSALLRLAINNSEGFGLQ